MNRSTALKSLYASVACAVLPLVFLGIPQVSRISHRSKTTADRSEHLTQVAKYYLARACYPTQSKTGLRKGDIIPHPQETACYAVLIDGIPMQWVYVVKNPQTGLIQVESVFTGQELDAKLSEIQSQS